MAKIKRRKLCWKASTSPQVIGYRLYWDEPGKVDYNSRSAILENVNEVVLPDDVEGFEPCGPVELGVSALDEVGNESSIITLDAPYQFNVPQMPQDLWIETLEEFHIGAHDRSAESKPIPLFEGRETPSDKPTAESVAKAPATARDALKYTRDFDGS